MEHQIIQKFKELYHTNPSVFKAPGRINLIGEHTDYNKGFVFPAAIDKAIILSIQLNNSSKVRLYAYDLDESLEVSLDKIEKSQQPWANYIWGVIDELKKKGFDVQGFDCVFGGNIPLGAGLSSSAALETVFTFALNHLHRFNIPHEEMIHIAQMAEVNFVGVKCGIMDQFISFSGKKDKAIILDCKTLDYTYNNVHLGDYSIVLVDTLVKHSLASGEYNLRRQECEQAVAVLKQLDVNIESLREATLEQLEAVKSDLSATVYRRAKYVIEENERVQKAGHYLENNQIEAFGKELFKTHKGLSELYEVSCPELDFLVEKAQEQTAVVGARMMGGGFGGCTINIVREAQKESFKSAIAEAFYQEFVHYPQFYDVQIEDGVKAI